MRIVLRRDHAAHKHNDVVGALVLERLDDGGHQRFVACSQRAHTHRVHIVFDGLAGAFFGGLEQRTHVHVKAQVGKRGGYHLGAPVVPVLA